MEPQIIQLMEPPIASRMPEIPFHTDHQECWEDIITRRQKYITMKIARTTKCAIVQERIPPAQICITWWNACRISSKTTLLTWEGRWGFVGEIEFAGNEWQQFYSPGKRRRRKIKKGERGKKQGGGRR